MRIIELIFIIVLSCMYLFCSPTQGDKVWFIGGNVYDADSEHALADVSCNFIENTHTYEIFSDMLGAYIFPSLGDPPDSVMMYFTKEGYIRLDTVLFFEDGKRSIDSVDIYLEPIQ